MLKITVEETDSHATIHLEGKLIGPWVGELERCWQRILAGPDDRTLLVNLNRVTFVDRTGRALLGEMHHAGAELASTGILNSYIVEQIKLQEASE